MSADRISYLLKIEKIRGLNETVQIEIEQLLGIGQSGSESVARVDEQLLNARNRCPIKQYIPSKPGKYGIKINWNVDATTSYPLFAENVGTQTQPNEERSTGIAHQLVLRLALWIIFSPVILSPLTCGETTT